MANFASLILVVLLLGGLVAAAVLLRRYRDRLGQSFAKGPIVIKGITNIGDGSRLILVDIDGIRAVCGVGRHGVGAITLLDKTPEPDKGA